jgi:hypothetical protein
VFIFLPFLTLVLSIITRASSYGDDAASAAHLADFPWEAPFLTGMASPRTPSQDAARISALR